MYTPAIARETPNPLPECVEMTGPLFSSVELAPPDPILGLNEAFGADPRPDKINLGVGVYFGEDGKIPVLDSVRRAEADRLANPVARGYQPIDGPAAYNRAVQDLLFGAGSDLAAGGRLVTAQSLGGTGALSLGAALLKRIVPDARVLISDPSWENHRALFEAAGFPVAAYPYYDAATHGLDFDGMRATLRAAAPHTIVVLHACCHNPTGVDLTPEQWNEIIAILRERSCIPFLDLAYQGFADGIEADSAVVRSFAASGMPCFIASSFSKSFSLYGERVGALTIVTAGADESRRVLSQLKRVIRTNYSNPPTHGAQVVTTVLSTPALRAQWEQELANMRERIRSMRAALVDRLKAHGVATDLRFITRQKGMFSYSGLTPQQMERLRAEYGIYGVSTGRICVAALNTHNIDYVAKAMAAIMR